MLPHHVIEHVMLGLAGCSALTCASFLRWGWRRQRQTVAWQRSLGTASPPPQPETSGGGTALTRGMADIAALVRGALAQHAPSAACGGVRLEMAVQPNLAVRTNHAVLHAALAVLIDHAIAQAPHGCVLVSGARRGGHVQIAVMDDGPGAPAANQLAALRDTAQAIALQGGTLEIEPVAGEGSVVTLRLPEPMGAAPPTVPPGYARPTPASAPDRVVSAMGHRTVNDAMIP